MYLGVHDRITDTKINQRGLDRGCQAIKILPIPAPASCNYSFDLRPLLGPTYFPCKLIYIELKLLLEGPEVVSLDPRIHLCSSSQKSPYSDSHTMKFSEYIPLPDIKSRSRHLNLTDSRFRHLKFGRFPPSKNPGIAHPRQTPSMAPSNTEYHCL